MERNTITIEGIPLRYMEKNKAAEKIIFFFHGNSGSAENWSKQWNDRLFEPYRLIAFDLPGCGESKIPAGIDWDYSLLAMGRLLAAAVRQLAGDTPYLLAGFSLGSNATGEMLAHDLSPAGLILISPSVVGEGYGLDKVFMPGDFIYFHDEPEKERVGSFFAAALVSGSAGDVRTLTDDFFNANPPFRSALIQTAMQGKLSDEILLLEQTSVPVLVLFGAEDQLLQTAYLDTHPFSIWRNTIHKIPAAGHFLHLDQAAVMNPILADYAAERFTAGRS